jgi:prophage tail gpP-like protein
MIIEVNGTEYTGWTKATATLRLDTLTNSFGFQATAKDAIPLPFRGGEDCTVKVDGEKILTGSTEIVEVDGESNSHTISVTGRDRTGDIVDSKIGSLSNIRPPITLKQVIDRVLAHIKSPVSVVSEYFPLPFVEAEDLASPEFGMGVWEFIEGLARKRQVLLSSDASGNIVIQRASGKHIGATLQNKIRNNSNNVLSFACSYDTTGLFRLYRNASQQNPVAINDDGLRTTTSMVEQISALEDTNVRSGRQFAILAENATSTGDLQERNKWEYNIRKTRSQTYSATVDGFRNQTGNLWAVNEVINVEDDFAGIESRMLVNSVVFSLGMEGRRTNLTLVHKDAYTLELPTQTSIDKLGVGLVKEGTDLVTQVNLTEPDLWVPWSPAKLFGDN